MLAPLASPGLRTRYHEPSRFRHRISSGPSSTHKPIGTSRRSVRRYESWSANSMLHWMRWKRSVCRRHASNGITF